MPLGMYNLSRSNSNRVLVVGKGINQAESSGCGPDFLSLLNLVLVRDHGQRLSLLPLSSPFQQFCRRLAHHLHPLSLSHRLLLLFLSLLGAHFRTLFAPEFPAKLLHDLLALVLFDQDPGDFPQVLIVPPILALKLVLNDIILEL